MVLSVALDVYDTTMSRATQRQHDDDDDDDDNDDNEELQQIVGKVIQYDNSALRTVIFY